MKRLRLTVAILLSITVYACGEATPVEYVIVVPHEAWNMMPTTTVVLP